MTIIAYRNGVLAGDTISTYGGSIMVRGKQKVFRRGDGTLYASAGNSAIGDEFKRWVAEGEVGKIPKMGKATDGIIVRPDGEVLFYDGSEKSTTMRPPYFAFGSGMEPALGAMFAGADAVTACLAAIEHDSGCGGEVTWVTHSGKLPTQPSKQMPSNILTAKTAWWAV